MPRLSIHEHKYILIYMNTSSLFLRRCLSLALSLAVGSVVAAETPPSELPTRVVQPREVALTLPAEGVVEALSQAVVAAQVAGRVTEMRVDAGQAVKKGEVMLRLDVREAAETAAGAQAALVNARAQYERSRSLRQQNFISQSALDKAKADLDLAMANAGASGASQSHGTITAPISGLVARRHIELGEMAAQGRSLVTLYDPAGLRVTVEIPQYRLKELKGGKDLQGRIEFPELQRQVAAAKVTVLPAADAATHTVQVRLNLPSDAASLQDVLPGMAARVHFVLGRAVKLTVPASAVVRRGEVAGLYVRDGQGRLSLRQLRLGQAVGDGEVEVLAGLSAGETIVLDPVRGGIALKQGAAR